MKFVSNTSLMKEGSITPFVCFIFIIVFFSIGCAPLYTPNLVHIPLFSDKNDADIQLATGTCGYDAQIAYAPINHLGVMINSSFKNKEVTDTNYFHKHNFVEGGVGFFGKINEAGRYECFAGYGNGNAQNYLEGWYGKVDGSYNRFFLQPSIGAKTDVFEGAFSVRLAYVDMYYLSRNTGYSRSELSAWYFEPVITAKIGYRFVKFFVQGGLSLPFESTIKYTNSPFILNFGLNLNFSQSYFKKKTQPVIN
ncbi:hypothetical protein BH10BAC1_BH10BAC1_07350 [soil metagenome]